MMNKIRIILGYLFSFILSVLIFLLCLTLIIKVNTNKDNVKAILIKNNYYENVYNEILEEMQNYMVSSGLSGEVLDDIFTKDIVKNDIDTYIDNLYLGKTNKVDTSDIEEKLTTNINNYLQEHNLKFTDQKSLNLFKKDIADIYSDEINLYNLLNGFTNHINKLIKLLNITIIGLIISIIVLFICNLLLKVKYMGSILSASGLMLILSKYLILNNIEIDYVTIITDNFSKIIRIIFTNINHTLIIIGLFLFIIGIFINIFMSNKSNKVLKNN